MDSKVINELQKRLDLATWTQLKQRKKVSDGLLGEGHLAYTDGFIDGIELAMSIMVGAAVLSERNEGHGE